MGLEVNTATVPCELPLEGPVNVATIVIVDEKARVKHIDHVLVASNVDLLK